MTPPKFRQGLAEGGARTAMAMQPERQGGAAQPRLSPLAQRFVLHWGEMGGRWGINRTCAQIHALLYLHGRPFHAEEIAALLGVARSNVSTSLRELTLWTLVRIVHLVDDRRDHYESAADPWELMRAVVRERKARELEPTVATLRECVADPSFARQPPEVQARLAGTLHLAESVAHWTDEMVTLDASTLARLLRMGARIRALVERAPRRR
jgi:DNA-binding transcriptional regulator GbsR (MarR family)